MLIKTTLLAALVCLSACKKEETKAADTKKDATKKPDAPKAATPDAAAPAVVAPPPDPGKFAAKAEVLPLDGQKVNGTVTFRQDGDETTIEVNLTGLTPGPHGFHVHEVGDCGGEFAKNAGKHFNPTAMDHGGPGMEKHHTGDMGNIEADKDGNAKASFKTKQFVVDEKQPNSVFNRSVIVHTGPDDLKTQPSGNSGKPIGCGVIKAGP